METDNTYSPYHEINSIIHSLNNDLLNTYYVLGTVLGTRATTMNKLTKSLPSWN